jgi:SAM-dependent methyltransferase
MASITDDRGFNQGYQWTPTQRVRMSRRARAILDAVPVAQRQRLLEIGCGQGEMASLLARDGTARVTGVDLCKPFIDEAIARFGNDGVSFVAADLSKPADVKRLGGNWSALVGNGILHHLYYNLSTALTGFYELLAPGGHFVFFEPNLFNPYVFSIFSFESLRKATRLEPDEMAFTPSFISKHLARVGFVDVEVSFKDFLIPNLPYALVPLVTTFGDWAEKIPGVDRLAQSILIKARKP